MSGVSWARASARRTSPSRAHLSDTIMMIFLLQTRSPGHCARPARRRGPGGTDMTWSSWLDFATEAACRSPVSPSGIPGTRLFVWGQEGLPSSREKSLQNVELLTHHLQHTQQFLCFFIINTRLLIAGKPIKTQTEEEKTNQNLTLYYFFFQNCKQP